ncbi:MAG: HD domain-containing phosphohydrolase [Acidobacteriota bacterium]
MPFRLLVVDDEEEIRTKLKELLETQGYVVDVASNGLDGLRAVEQDPSGVDIVLTDFKMPQMNGIELADRISQVDSKIVVLLITAFSDKETAIAAMRTGVSDFLDKPFTLHDLMFALKKAGEKRTIILQNENYKLNLERMVWERTQEVQRAFREIKGMYRQTLEALGAALDTRDVETQSHSRRVAGYTVALAFKLGLPRQQVIDIERGALLHDVGKIGVPDAIFLKPGPLSEEEWQIMRSHAELGYRMIRNIEFLREASLIVYSHHERYDGLGYPRGLMRDEIPIGARIFAVADTLDAMTSDRVYRNRQSFDSVRAEIRKYSGTQFDPKVVDSFLQIPEESWLLIRERAEGGESLAEAPDMPAMVSGSLPLVPAAVVHLGREATAGAD